MPTAFGRTMLAHWPLAPDAVYLNHGTVGVTPRRVLAAQQALRDEIERHPARFLLRELMSLDAAPPAEPRRLRAAAERVAGFLGARGDDLVLVDNASSGINAVLRSLRLEADDEILLFEHAYGAVERAARYVARERGARVTTVALQTPPTDPAACLAALEAGLTERTRIAVIDHVTSETALVLPVEAMAALCRAHGVPVLVDGAHAPGAIAVDLGSLGVDWYVANLHKWAFAPRGCGVLWARPERQAGLHPSVISWGLDVGWHQEFDWTGTRDPTPWLCAPDGIAFITEFLGTDAMRAYNHALARNAARRLAARWGTPWTTPESMIGCMVSVPLPARLGADAAQAQRLKDWLLFERRIEAPVMARGGRLWARLSAQVYNDDDDIERFAAAVDEAAATA
ncbi:MAG: aminotransferase class V-fold PLP-dependent enzyme [Proteobacteria bacterium]|nr:aminotransferase class V-fold PLP-dependent enzyme [Pseudomonadota bacterium]